MHSLAQLKKQQVGLRLPRYLVEEIDEMSEFFALNRTEIITEAVDYYKREQKALIFYENLVKSAKSVHEMRSGQLEETDLEDLIDELAPDSDS